MATDHSQTARSPLRIEDLAPRPLPVALRPVPRRTPPRLPAIPMPRPDPRSPPPRDHGPTAAPTGRVGLRCWILSDLHVDEDVAFALPNPLPEFDVLLVAGGIACGLDASLTWLARALDGRQGTRPVVMVPGAREFRSELPLVEALSQGRERARSLGIDLLSDDTVRVEGPDGRGIHVVGATLWTNWALLGAFQGKLARVGARHGWPDGDRILLRRGRPWTPLDALAVHARSRAFIEDALTGIVHQAMGCPCPPRALVEDVRPGDRAVVLTCHAPSRHSLPYDWAGWLQDDWVAASLASDLEDVLQSWGAPTLWVHGNVPGRVDHVIDRTRVVANPRGDPGSAFDAALVVEA